MTDATDHPERSEARGDEAELLRTAGSEARTGAQRWNSAIPVESSRDPRSALRHLAQVIGGERSAIGVVLGCTIAAVVLTALGPRLLGGATDTIVAAIGPRRLDTGRLNSRLAVIAGVYVAAWAFGHVQARVLTGALQRSMRRLRDGVEAKLYRLPLSYIDHHARGDLLSRVTNDIDNLSQSLQQSINQILTSILMVVTVGVMMLTVSPLLALVACVTIPLAAVATRRITASARPKFLEQWSATGALNGQVEEVITAHDLVTVFGRADEVCERFDQENERVHAASRSAQFLSSLMGPIGTLMGNVQFIAIAVVGGLQVTSGTITVGGMQAMIQYARQFSEPVQQIAAMTATLQSGLASLERVVELLNADDEIVDPPADASDGPSSGHVRFEGVRFSYEPGQPLIEGLDLDVEPRQTVAIVGPTGAGKTTLVNLLLRFYELEAGRIVLDGRDIATMSRRQLRSAFGMVLQDTWLFSGTILENIRYGDPDATDEQVRQAATATYVDRFVGSLPDGYQTWLDGGADQLSSGERQLLTIARAHLADPAVLILDEATSSVDTRTEMLIQDAMAALSATRTSFVIAHRLSTIRHADLIVVMDGGRIVEQGDHATLIARGGAYAALYEAQYRGVAT